MDYEDDEDGSQENGNDLPSEDDASSDDGDDLEGLPPLEELMEEDTDSSLDGSVSPTNPKPKRVRIDETNNKYYFY